jgi:formylglycine-generating enzyme required for sulfatase activity
MASLPAITAADLASASLEVRDVSDGSTGFFHPLATGHPPSWARGWGQDRHGVFVEIKAGTVKQRLRWIPPGTFRLGSPESEAGRFEWEGPRHEVELNEGFWLADTPCTQELWQEVMGGNASRFKSARRPVESVSWDDCQSFLETLSAHQPGLELRLPTEAQWEYACRAGTETATWLGDLEILGANNAPVLDEIAWYGGNSGVRFELAEGHDSTEWPEKQHPHERAGTREVKLKRPNPWGLYDMLGNVWEWCSDGAIADPEEEAVRVFRGGSWSAHARYVRAAYRNWYPRDARDEDLGFRVSRGQGREAWSSG